MSKKEAEYDRLVSVYAQDLYRYAVWLCKDPLQAEDIVQETYLRAWKSLDRLKNRDSPKPWLFTILRNEFARQYARIRPETREFELDLLEGKDTQNDISTEAFVLHQALDSLPESYREPLLLQVLGGFSCEEIGAICEISKGAAMTRLFRAKEKLRNALNPPNS